METETMSEFMYFVNLFWPFFTGAIAVRVICGLYGDIMYWISKSFGDGSH